MGNTQSNAYSTQGVCLASTGGATTTSGFSSFVPSPGPVLTTVSSCTTKYASPVPSGASCDVYGHLKKPALLTTTTLTSMPGKPTVAKYQNQCDAICNKNSQCDSFGYAVKNHVCLMYKSPLSKQTVVSPTKYSSTIYFDKGCYTQSCKTQVKTVTGTITTAPTTTSAPATSTCDSTPNPTYTSVLLNDPSKTYTTNDFWEVDLPFPFEFYGINSSTGYISMFGVRISEH